MICRVTTVNDDVIVMTVPDFAAIMADAADDVRVSCMAYCYGGSFNVPEAVALQLAAKVPQLCQTCGGTQRIAAPEGRGDGLPDPGWCAPCPDCPTIARLLAIGAAVMTATLERSEWVALDGDKDLTRVAGTLLARLRAVQP